MSTTIMRQRHAAYTTPESIIFALVQRATDQRAVARQEVTRGYDNEVYTVTTDQAQEFVVRIRRHGDVGFAQEAWAIARCRATGVPVPDVLLVNQIAEPAWAGEVMVQEKIEGHVLKDLLPTLTPAECARVIAQAGEALHRIHRVQVDGFYRLRSNWEWDFPTWEAVMHSHITDRTAELPLLRECGFTETEMETMLTMMEQEQEWRERPCPHPVLCHGEFHPGHLLVTDTHQLSGVIDFGEFYGGGPMGDVVVFNMECPAIDLGWLAEGYGQSPLFDETFPVRLVLAKVGLQMGSLAHYLRSGITEEVAPAVEGLRTTLQRWKQLHG